MHFSTALVFLTCVISALAHGGVRTLSLNGRLYVKEPLLGNLKLIINADTGLPLREHGMLPNITHANR
jgi:hypothetical protein